MDIETIRMQCLEMAQRCEMDRRGLAGLAGYQQQALYDSKVPPPANDVTARAAAYTAFVTGCGSGETAPKKAKRR